MVVNIEKTDGLKGELFIPGDKSISHRAVIFASLARGKSRIKGFLESEDCLNTLNAFRNMGVNINKNNKEYIIDGVGLYGLKEPVKVINCGNSGTSMRLLSGLLTAQKYYSVLSGDASLRTRPMNRIIEPLKSMNANIWARKGGYAPLSINGSKLKGIKYRLPVASAQVKSSLLLAALYIKDDLYIEEPGNSRNHTELMMKSLGIHLDIKGNLIKFPGSRNKEFLSSDFIIPGDISSAAFFIVATLITKNSEVLLKNIGINPGRIGIIDVVKKMGGHIELLNEHMISGENVADIYVKSSKLKGIRIEGDIIPGLIDEIPVISVLASQAEGETIIKDALELRFKESDRIKIMVNELTKLNVNISSLSDGMIIKGPSKIKGGIELDSYGDHRIAMSLIVLGLLSEKKIGVKGTKSINTSFPGFLDILKSL
jgi:3-phosphoshikimate 1-carboxyvinyltransferase